MPIQKQLGEVGRSDAVERPVRLCALVLLALLALGLGVALGMAAVGAGGAALLLALAGLDARGAHQATQAASERQTLQTRVAHLERKLKKRSAALDLAQRRLHDLAITDDLTGAFNRQHFNDFCTQLLAHQPRQQPLAFCVFDIDHFKDFNACHGHGAGDEALHAVSGAVQAELRRSGDLLFRLGGAEFGVLFTATTPEGAAQFVERLRGAIRELRITHPGQPAGIVTASFGLAWWGVPGQGELTHDALYAHADSLLREAKAAGRDRVVVQAL